MRLKTLSRFALVPATAMLALAGVPQAALAQSAPRVTFTPSAAPAASAPSATVSQAADASYWELIGGIEFDTDGMMYGFFGPQWNRPLTDNVALTARAYVNWLQYEFDEFGGTTKVSGPGVSTQVGLRFGDRSTFKVGIGPSVKWRGEKFIDDAGNEADFGSETEVGFSVGADANLNPTEVDNIHGIVSYETVDEYLWSRLAYKRQITNLDWRDTWAHHVGAEGILQGNDDIRTVMLGGLVEFVHAPSRTSLMLRGGFKRSTFDAADDRTGPYFGFNFYKRLGQ